MPSQPGSPCKSLQGIQKTESADVGQLQALCKRDYVFALSILLLIGLLGEQQGGMFSSNDEPDVAVVVTEKSVAVLPFVAMSSGPLSKSAAKVAPDLISTACKPAEVSYSRSISWNHLTNPRL